MCSLREHSPSIPESEVLVPSLSMPFIAYSMKHLRRRKAAHEVKVLSHSHSFLLPGWLLGFGCGEFSREDLA